MKLYLLSNTEGFYSSPTLHCASPIYNTYKSFAMYKKASDMGHVEAIHMLGLSYILGLGVEKDINKAMSLVQKAADLGSLEATCFLGDAYYYGKSMLFIIFINYIYRCN